MPVPSIALIEDDPVQQMILQQMLEGTYAVDSYTSIEETLTGLQDRTQQAPDLILCDIALPDGDGFALREHINRMNHLSDCPFIFLTGMEDEVTKERAAALGVDDFLQKPISRQNLLTRLHQSLTRKKQMNEALAKKLGESLSNPLRPQVPTLIGAYHLTLRSEEKQAGGGDFVFHVTHPQGMDYIFIGDVMGHGAPAKFFLHAYNGYLYGRLQALRHQKAFPRAGELLRELNHTLHTDPFLKHWLTSCLVLCIPRNGALSFAVGGHPPPWLIGAGPAQRLQGKGLLPGLLPDSQYETTIVALQPGQSLLLKTDGLRLSPEMIDQCASMNAEKMLEGLFALARTNDDATALVVERV